MTDDRVATCLLVDGEWLEFQEYFVHRRHEVPVEAVRYERIEAVRPTRDVLDAIARAEVVVLVNSNPVLSILPILSLPGVREAVAATPAPRVAVSPLIGTAAVSGPAAELMGLIGQPASATGVAAAYRGLIDGIVIDRQDVEQKDAIEALGIAVRIAETLMRDDADRERLAAETLAFARGLR